MNCSLGLFLSRLYDSRLAYLASLLLILLQRSPVLHSLTKARQILSQPLAQMARLAAPAAVVAGSTHAVTGATGVVPAGGSVNPAEAIAGENFVWVFRVTGETAHSYSATGLPEGVALSREILRGGISSIGGVPEEEGDFTVRIRGWEEDNQRGDSTPPYVLHLKIAAGDPPEIVAPPIGGEGAVSEDVNLQVEAKGAGLHYRWLKDGEEVPSNVQNWVGAETVRRVWVLQESLERAWRDVDYDDTSWLSGSGGVGYERSNDKTFDPFIDVDVEAEMYRNRTSAMVRMAFELGEADLRRANELRMRIQYDDGFVAFLNGVPVAHVNAPAPLFLSWSSKATDAHNDDQAVEFEEFDLVEHVESLKVGKNVLAIQILNESANSSDLLCNVELLGGRDTDRPVLELSDLTENDAGQYQVEVRNGAGVVVSDPVNLEVDGGSGPTGYEAWQLEHWPETPTIELASPDADPDRDSQPNLLEYHLNSDPLRPDGRVATSRLLDGDRVELRFPRGSTEELSVIYEVSGNLESGEWTTLEDGVDGVEIDASDDASVRIRMPLGGDCRYVRLRVQR